MSDTSDALTDVYIIATGWHAGTIEDRGGEASHP